MPYTNSSDLDETLSLIQIQAVWHSDNIFTNFEQQWSTLKIEADEKFRRHQFILRAKGKYFCRWACKTRSKPNCVSSCLWNQRFSAVKLLKTRHFVWGLTLKSRIYLTIYPESAGFCYGIHVQCLQPLRHQDPIV